MNTEVMFSSKTDLHSTPQWLFDELNREFGFDLDVCATKENAKCRKYFDKNVNGLNQFWKTKETNTIWMNPPYGRDIPNWIYKAYYESKTFGATVVCLLPARTDTKWFHDYIYEKAEIRFIKGRLKFGNAKNSAPFPSMVVIFNGRRDKQ